MAGMNLNEREIAGMPQFHREEDLHELPTLSRLELACMRAIWLDKAVTVHDVQRCLKYSRPLAYTTVFTVLDRMVQKGAVTRTKKGRAYLYQPAFSFEESRDRALRELIECYFEGSPKSLVDHLGQTEVAARAAMAPPSEASTTSDSSDISICLL